MAWPIIHLASRAPPDLNQHCLVAFADQLARHADQLGAQAGRARLLSFHRWARDALVSGSAPLFGLTRVKTWSHSQVTRHGGISSRPQAIADSQMDMWNRIWEGTTVSAKPGLGGLSLPAKRPARGDRHS
eukprot:62091-Pyramimonas_sp.AAC.1